MIDYALVGTCGDSRSERKTTATAHSPIERLGETGAAECQPLFSRASARTRRSIMDRDLANWNLGMADAESGSLAALGRSRDYYDGYDYAYAVNYEYIGALPEFAGEGDLSQIGSDSATVGASDFSAQLNRLNSRLLDSHSASLPAGAGLAAVCTAADEAALRDHDARTTSSTEPPYSSRP